MLLQEHFQIAENVTTLMYFAQILHSSLRWFGLMQYCSPMNTTKIHHALLYGLYYPDHLSVATTAPVGPSTKNSIYIFTAISWRC